MIYDACAVCPCRCRSGHARWHVCGRTLRSPAHSAARQAVSEKKVYEVDVSDTAFLESYW